MWKVPSLSVKKADAMLGNKPVLLGKGAFGVAYLISRTNTVVKFSFNYTAYVAALAEAQAMTALKDVPGVQRLVGVCPERAMIATAYAGPILYDWLREADALLPEEWVAITLKVAEVIRAIHAKGIIHNDIKNDNICVKKTPHGVEVTVIDFGMSKREGQHLYLSGSWTQDSHNPPEFFRPQGGKCSSLSDVYSVGQVLKQISSCVGLQMTSILKWYMSSQKEYADSRDGLDALLEDLRSRATLAR
ncbi:serine/threonine-protein kinase pkn2-like [Penaeus monodon]|uniref:serine/threonine-protein kinase pkn2-like n=1 Tax=Penaeus monodon TaxID=6687 RepID=UPI0018A74CDB|nr:serine/threonine-protein kinase pkn2-like [Penaeus monodon]